MTPLLTACGGFLLAVLWMDLIFDVQVLAHRRADGELPEPVLGSIAGYYRRATTTSRPMSLLILAVMVILLSALGFEAVRRSEPLWVSVSSALLAAVPVGLAVTRTVPNAVRLGGRTDTASMQARIARSICRDHLCCLACIGAFVALRLVHG